MNIFTQCEEYLAAGFALVELQGKSPIRKGWNNSDKVIKARSDIPASIRGVGLAHAFSTPTTCALDIDDFQLSTEWLLKQSIDLPALLTADDAVQIVSGRANKAKLVYRLPAGLKPVKSHVVRIDGNVILEFRCASSSGLTMQDVLPPTVHPDTGCSYQWGGLGSYKTMPEIPAKLLDVWLRAISQSCRAEDRLSVLSTVEASDELDSDTIAVGGFPETKENIQTVVEALKTVSADCNYVEWRNLVMALHSTGWECAWRLARDWSMTAPKRWDATEFEQLWSCLRTDGGITIGTLLYQARRAASVSEDNPASPADRLRSTNIFELQDGQLAIPTQSPGRRTYLFGGSVVPGTLAVLAGLGGTAKTIFALQLAVHGALGRALGDFQVSEFSSMIFLGEETAQERDRRIGAICSGYSDSDLSLVEQRVSIFPAAGQDLRLTWLQDGNVVALPFVQEVIELARAHYERCGVPLGMIVFDHARLVMAGDPNSAEDVTQLTRVLTEIAIKTGSAVLLLAHSPKNTRVKETSADAAEVFGSSAFVDNARCAFVLNTMRINEAKEFEMSESDRQWHICLTAAKVNYGPTGQIWWFKKEALQDWDSIRLKPVTLYPVSLFRNHSVAANNILARVSANRGKYTERKLRDIAGKDGPLKASDAEVRRTLQRMVEEGTIVARPPTDQERNQYSISRNVHRVLDIP